MNLFYDGLALQGLGKYDQAVAKLSDAIKMKPDYVDFYLFRGSCNRYLNKFDLANADFNSALKIQPTNVYAQHMKQVIEENIKGKSNVMPMQWQYVEK